MQKGKIVQLFRDKEYGLIRTKGGEDVHFHKQCLWGIRFDELCEGQAVKFWTQLTSKGLLGFEIRPA
jgi:cold shock CspA family protein